MNYQYVGVDRIFSKLDRDISEVYAESEVIEMIGEALEFIGTVKAYEPAVAFIEVKNHQCVLPRWLHGIEQIARDNDWECKKDRTTPAAIVDAVGKPYCKTQLQWSEEDSEYIMLDCDGSPIYDYELAYYRPYFDLKWEHLDWANTGYFRNKYTPVRRSTGSFANNMLHTSDTYTHHKDTYDIIRGTMLRLSFKEGMVAVAYNRQIIDEKTGYPMVPDSISHTTAIVWYIALKRAEKDFMAGREGAKGRVDMAEDRWDWYCGQASNQELMPYGVDDHQDLLDQRQRLLPKLNDYDSFFGNMAEGERRKYNDPDNRNRTYRYLIR